MMDKEDLEKENTSDIVNHEMDNSDHNEEIEIIPYHGGVDYIIEAVTYGPPTDLHDDDVTIFEEPDIPIAVDINSDMYGGPIPEYLLQDEIYINDIIDFSSEIESLIVEDADSKDTAKDRDSNNNNCDDDIA